jgi:metal-responsive CopG/Arc/MetJ family transcriptional regulator
MKTAISIPDSVFEEAESLAKRRGMSRSELYAKAVAEYVKGERFLGVRERLDAVYAAHPEDSELDPTVEQLQTQSLPKEKW